MELQAYSNAGVLYSIYFAASSPVSIFVGSLGLLSHRLSILTIAAIHSLICLLCPIQRSIFIVDGKRTWEINRFGYLSATETFVMQTDF